MKPRLSIGVLLLNIWLLLPLCAACSDTTPTPVGAEVWRSFDFANLAALDYESALQSHFVVYLDSLSAATPQQADASLQWLVGEAAAAGPRSLINVMDEAERLLYEPSSPWYDESRFLPMADAASRAEDVEPYMRMRWQLIVSSILKNRPGTHAPDLDLVLRNGEGTWLSALTAGCTAVVAFYDPQCDTCHGQMQALIDNPVANPLVKNGNLLLLAIYPDGDAEVWERHAGTLPPYWIDTRTTSDDISSSYPLRSTPTLYLLDPKGVILQKNTSVGAIIAALESK